jgi:hemerythrin-like metal-binding protein
MLIKWRDIHSVNVKEFDEQHKKLVEIINEFFASGPDNKEALKLIVGKLIEYSNYHLENEEAYFKKFNYPEAADHLEKHNFYRHKVLEFSHKLETAEGAEIFNELSEFLRDWWIMHINNIDQEYSNFFNKNGLF